MAEFGKPEQQPYEVVEIGGGAGRIEGVMVRAFLIVGEERAPEMLRKVKASRLKSIACGVIMLVATAIALPLMFWATSYGDPFWSRYFWLPWMVGGLLCGIAGIVPVLIESLSSAR